MPVVFVTEIMAICLLENYTIFMRKKTSYFKMKIFVTLIYFFKS